MNRYRVTVDVTSRYTIDVDAGDETEAESEALNRDLGELEKDGIFQRIISAEAVDSEQIYPEEEDG